MFFLDVADLKRLQNKKNVCWRGGMIKDEGLTARTCRKVWECEINNEQ